MKRKIIVFLILAGFVFVPKIISAQDKLQVTPSTTSHVQSFAVTKPAPKVKPFDLIIKPTPTLKILDVIMPLTTQEEGGGARPEIIFLDNNWFLVYRDSLIIASSFRFKDFGQELAEGIRSKTLISSSVNGGVTDIRLAKNGSDVYAAYEMASTSTRKLFIAKYDKQFKLAASAQVAEAVANQPQQEALDDPVVVVGNNLLYVMTRLNGGYRIREFKLDLTSTGKVIDIDMSSDAGVASAVYVNGNFYVVTSLYVSGRALCPAADSTTNNDLYVFVYDKNWRFTGTSKTVTSEANIEYYPTSLKYANERFYITYLENGPDTYLPDCETEGSVGTGAAAMVILDKDLNPLINQKISDQGQLTNHPTLEVIDDKVYVVYGLKEDSTGIGPDSSNIWLREFQYK